MSPRFFGLPKTITPPYARLVAIYRVYGRSGKKNNRFIAIGIIKAYQRHKNNTWER